MKSPGRSTLTRDADIRKPLLSWIVSQHINDGATEVLEEFDVLRPSGRIDIAVINGEICGFEIKSDCDTLSRLKFQIPAFSKCFDKISIVTTRKHLRKARNTIPKCWGLLLFESDGSFRIARHAKQNTETDLRSILFSLTKEELIQVSRGAGASLSSSRNKNDMVEFIIRHPKDTVLLHARNVLRQRKLKCF